MEVVVLIGLQGSGKSTFAHARYGATHVRISRDVVKTPHRERILQYTCLGLEQSFVADNTHPDPAARAPVLAAARGAGARVVACYFAPDVPGSLARNAGRAVGRVPDVAIYATVKRLVAPTYAEGFDAIYQVTVGPDGYDVNEVPREG